MARNIALHFGSVDPLFEATQEELQEVDGVGPDRAELIVEWFAEEENRALVAELRGRSGCASSSGRRTGPSRGR